MFVNPTWDPPEIRQDTYVIMQNRLNILHGGTIASMGMLKDLYLSCSSTPRAIN